MRGGDEKCRDLRAHVSAYLDDELEPVKAESIERHCAECAHCQDIVEGLRATIALCRHTSVAPLPAAVRERARAKVRALLNSAPSVRRMR